MPDIQAKIDEIENKLVHRRVLDVTTFFPLGCNRFIQLLQDLLASERNQTALAAIDSINLSGSNAGDQGFRQLLLALSKFEPVALRHLDLSASWLWPASLAHLFGIQLCDFVPAATTIPPCAPLVSLASVRVLDLSANHLGDEGVAMFAVAAAHGCFPALETLLLDNNGITDVGCVILANTALLHLRSLKVLTVGQNDIGDTGAKALARLLGGPNLFSEPEPTPEPVEAAVVPGKKGARGTASSGSVSGGGVKATAPATGAPAAGALARPTSSKGAHAPASGVPGAGATTGGKRGQPPPPASAVGSYFASPDHLAAAVDVVRAQVAAVTPASVAEHVLTRVVPFPPAKAPVAAAPVQAAATAPGARGGKSGSLASPKHGPLAAPAATPASASESTSSSAPASGVVVPPLTRLDVSFNPMSPWAVTFLAEVAAAMPVPLTRFDFEGLWLDFGDEQGGAPVVGARPGDGASDSADALRVRDMLQAALPTGRAARLTAFALGLEPRTGWSSPLRTLATGVDGAGTLAMKEAELCALLGELREYMY